MGKEDLVIDNPLRVLGLEQKVQDNDHRMGLVMARAGLGKTAILVQIALDSILRGNKVLHVSIDETVDKTRAWYDDILTLMAEGKSIDNFQEVVAEVMANRMIMTFKENTFSPVTLEERLNDLVKQDIFKPTCLIIDGFDFKDQQHETLKEMRNFMYENGLTMIWFSAVSHRNDDRISDAGVPAPCHEVDDLFDSILLIDPEKEAIDLKILKCNSGSVDAGTSLRLDPSTMLIEKA
ncbi:MAG: hypothetical protein ABFS19_05725 [Thermodesulfobacteriota bacterium]